jgi:putative ABC transport system ATP-binding protein
MTLVRLENVSKVYPGGVVALRDVDLDVNRGEFVAIVGPSGSGKSTMLHVIGTLDRPSSGSVFFDGVDVAGLSDRQVSALRARRVGFVFQQFHLASGVSTLDNVADGLLYAGVGPAGRRAAARAALDRVGLGHRLSHRPHELSGGEKQRVAIARAVLGEPDLVLADEPTGNLDSATAEAVLALFAGLHAEGRTIVVVTHERDIRSVAGREVTLQDGRVVTDERTEVPA